MEKIDQRLIAVAAEWVVKLEDPETTEDTHRAYEAWIAEDTEHGRAIKHVREVWSNLGVVANLVDGKEKFDSSSHQAGDVNNKSSFSPNWRLVRPSIPVSSAMAVAACIGIIAAIFVGITSFHHFPLLPKSHAVYETPVGIVDVVSLPDGSTIHVNTSSRVVVDYTRKERRISLEKGEAHFDVVSDARRPFTVYVAGQIVQAIGTEFSVRIEKGRLRVAVAEGRVLVSPNAQEPDANNRLPDGSDMNGQQVSSSRSESRGARYEEAILGAGTRAEIGADESLKIAEVSVSEIERQLAWRHGGLIFDRQRLADVVAEISNYTPVNIVIADPDLREMQVGGYFRIGDIESMLTVLESGFGLEIEKIDESTIEIRSASNFHEKLIFAVQKNAPFMKVISTFSDLKRLRAKARQSTVFGSIDVWLKRRGKR